MKHIHIAIATAILLVANTALSSDKGNALCAAAKGADVAALKVLLDQGTPVDERNDDGQTALMHAAANGSLEAVDMLLTHGADPSALSTNALGSNVLSWSTESHNTQIVKKLVDAGAKINVQGRSGLSPLGMAISGGTLETVEFLIS